jgi:hypothetical protein
MRLVFLVVKIQVRVFCVVISIGYECFGRPGCPLLQGKAGGSKVRLLSL